MRATVRRSRIARYASRGHAMQLENLEPRVVLAGDLVIAEVMTDNDKTIDDEDGTPSDWVELYNKGNQPVDLTGWHLTDDLADRSKWTMEGGSIAPGESLIVFASNKDRRDPSGELHTNFRLGDGEYLGLYLPDGRTVGDSIDALPVDYEDVSYGISQNLSDVSLVNADSSVSVWIPTSADQQLATSAWTSPDFDASTWTVAQNGVGFDADPSDGDFQPLISDTGDIGAAMRGNASSAYIRSEFTLPETLPTYKNLGLQLNYDDGFVAYLNGRQISSVNAPADPAWDSTATEQHGGIAANIRYDDFNDADARDDYTVLGDAQWIDGRLALTASAENQTGAAWLSNPVPFGSDFTFSASTIFDFHTPGGVFADRDGLGGEGMTFVLQGNDNNVLGLGGGGLGLDNTGSTFLSIEVDSNATGSWDPDDSLPSHLGVTTSAAGSVARTGISRFNGDAFFAGSPGPGTNLMYLWVDYVGETQTLDVFMAKANEKPAEPTLTTTVDMSELFAGSNELYLGWTASTSDAYNGQEVLGWNILTGVGELGRDAESFNLSDHVDALQPGTNVLAIHALNIDAADEDLLINSALDVQEVILGGTGYFATPSPNELNGSNSLAPSGTVTFSRDSSIYVDPFDLELISPADGATIYYTLDGSIPDETSDVYTTPLNITGPVRVRARAIEIGRGLGPINTAGFTQLNESLTNFENGEVFSSNLPLLVFEGFDSDPGRQTSRLVPTVGYFIDVGDDGVSRLTDEPIYAGRAGLRARGQSSEGWPKKQYALEIWREGNDDSSPLRANEAADLDVSLFGLPADSDYVLNGPYSDKTQLNNFLTFNWYRDLGLKAPRTRLVEVFVNPNGSELDYENDYRGTYVLLEKIKISEDRVDIAEIEPGVVDGEEITGGYIWKKDKAGAGDRPFRTDSRQELRMVEPQDPRDRDNIRPGEITQVQKDWLLNHLNEFEAALFGDNFADPKEGYAAYIDVASWVDVWLIVEMTKNIDGFRLSTYYHKDVGGKIQQGPGWDFNLSLGNGNYLQGAYPEGWYHDGISADQYPYWGRLFEDPNFEQAVADRWAELRQTTFSTENLLADIDAAVAQLSNNNPNLTNLADGELSNPISRNYDRWTTNGYGESVYHWPNCFFGQGGCPRSPLPAENSANGRPDSYDDYVYIMQWFLSERVEWMDSQFAPPLDVTPRGGPVDSGTPVTVVAPEGYEVFYTLDGTDPRDPLVIQEETTVLESGGSASILVPADNSLIDQCDDGLRLPNSGDACFVKPAYTLGANGETWTDVTMPIGYDTEGDYAGLINTDVQSTVQNVNSSVYLRIPFTLDEATKDSAERLTLKARYDDGFIAYMWFNTLSTPVEIARANAGDSSRLPIDAVGFDAAATGTNPDEQAIVFEDFDVSDSIAYMRPGETNYLVVQVMNEDIASSDFLADFQLIVGTDRIEIAPSVIRYDGPVTIDRNTRFVARGYDAGNDEWTAASSLTFVVDSPALAITELNYHPYPPTASELAVNPELDEDDFEFVEIKNVGSAAAGLIGMQFDGFESILGRLGS